MNVLKTLRNKAYQTAVNYFSHATLVEGILKGANQPFQCLFVDNTSLMEYLLPKIYVEPPVVVKKWRIWIPGLKKIISKPPDSLDMCIAVLPVHYEPEFYNLYDFKTQEYVCQIINTCGSWDQIRKRFHDKKRQLSNNLIQRNTFTHKISNDPKDFDFFYQSMFLPHIQKKYQELSHLDEYEEMKEHFSNGFLLFVMDGDKAVAGALCIVRNSTLIFRRTGVLEGNEDYIKKGAQLALYHFNILYAHEHGLQRVDTMKSRPFFTDGVYRTKREWGATVYPDDGSLNWVYYFNPRFSEKMVSCLENIPTIGWTKEGLKGIVGLNADVESMDAVNKDLMRKFYAPGLEGLLLLTPRSKKPIELPFKTDEKQNSIFP